MKTKFKLHNEFDIVSTDINTNKSTTLKAYNVITTTGLNVARTGSGAFGYIALGSGSGTPSEADTKLFTYVTSKQFSVQSRTFDASTNTYTARFLITLNETEMNGNTFTELGLANTSYNSGICTHAMIVDEHGAPMSITKTDTMILKIYATVYLTVDLTDIHFIDPNVSILSLFGSVLGSSLYSCGVCCHAQGPLNSSSYGNIDKGATTTNISNGRKVSYDIMGSEMNGKLVRYLGFGRQYYWNNAAYAPGIIMDITNKSDMCTKITKEVVGTGDDSTTFFPITYPHPVKNNAEFKVYVNNEEKVATPVVTKSYDCFAKHINTTSMRNKYYKLEYSFPSSSGSVAKLYFYEMDDPQYPTTKTLVGYDDNYDIEAFASDNSFQMYPTHLENVFILYRYKYNSSYIGCYLVKVNPTTKKAESYTKITGGAFGGYGDDPRFMVMNTQLYFLNDAGELSTVGTAYRILGNIVLNTSNNTIHKIYVQDSMPKMEQIGTYTRTGTNIVGQIKKLPEPDMYAVIIAYTLTSDTMGESVDVTIINSATGKVTNEAYKMPIPNRKLYNNNSSTDVACFTYKYSSPSYDFCLDTEHKIAYPYEVISNTDIIVTNQFFDKAEKQLTGSSGTAMEIRQSPEFVIGFTLVDAPPSGSTVSVSGELFGFLKTADYKLSYSAEFLVNA